MGSTSVHWRSCVLGNRVNRGRQLLRSKQSDSRAASTPVGQSRVENRTVVHRDIRAVLDSVPKLLEVLTLPGMLVTGDAMHCQRQLSQQVMDQGADYVLALKGNQESLNEHVRLFLDDPATPLAQASQTNRGHAH